MRMLSSGSSTLQTFAKASASNGALGDDGRGDVALDGEARSWIEDVRVPTAVDPEPALGVPAGGDRSVLDRDISHRLGRLRIRPGVGDPDRAVDLAADAKVAAHVEHHAEDPAHSIHRQLAGAFHDVSLGDPVEAERTIRQALGRPARVVQAPGGPVHRCLRIGPFAFGRQPALPGAGRPEPREGLDAGIERPATPGPPRVGRREDVV